VKTTSWGRTRALLSTALRSWVWAPQPVQLLFRKKGIWVMATSEIERKYRLRSAMKEPWTVEWLEGHVHTGQVLYDIGANVGAFSLIGAVHCGAAVVAFEPGFANYARLCENIRLNGCGTQIIALPWLLAERAGLRTFEYRSIEAGQSRHVMHDGTDGTTRPGHYVQMMAALVRTVSP
jgi:FkbM family methyltransferase